MFKSAHMNQFTGRWRDVYSLLVLLALCLNAPSETFRVATYNLESYLDNPLPGRPAKSPESRAVVRRSILALKPDVLALEEVGSSSALDELRGSLKSAGLDLPYAELISATDTNIHIGLLSRFPFAASRPHTNDSFLLNGRRFHVSRGFAEVDLHPAPGYSFTLIAAHLKSRRTLSQADEAEIRLEEAKILREIIEARLAADPNANLVVLGDFNDTKDCASTRVVMGSGKTRLLDTRPAESNGENFEGAGAPAEPRRITWTHFYSKEDVYQRIDFLLLSKGMAREWIPAQTFVLAMTNWGVASDHRPIVATFEAVDR